jgi:UDP:flavonoid glycosyltransferase YjiC (YdhE family)
VFRKSTLEQIGEFIQPTWQALIDGAKYVNPRLEEIIAELEPDAVVEDNVVSFPAVMASGRPWVRIVSCNPPKSGPARSAPVRPPAADPRWAGPGRYQRAHARWLTSTPSAPRRAVDERARPLWRTVATEPYCTWRGGLPRAASRPHLAPAGLHDPGDDVWGLPEDLAGRPGALIYLSLGSLGSADVGLMQRLVDVLGRTSHRVIVSRWPLHDQIRLHDNMAGEQFLPQPAVLPQVDLVITHGGNNTVVESFHNGKPMIVLPLFWDQVDNAQRVHETGFGRRLSTYGFRDEELTGAIDTLLADTASVSGMAAIAARCRRRRGRRGGGPHRARGDATRRSAARLTWGTAGTGPRPRNKAPRRRRTGQLPDGRSAP